MDTNVDIMKLDLKSVTKTVLQQGIKIEEFQKKHKELEVYAKERCENQPFVRVENLAQIQSEINYKVEHAELAVNQARQKITNLE